MDKFNALNLGVTFRPLEDAIFDYVNNYMEKEDKYLPQKTKRFN